MKPLLIALAVAVLAPVAHADGLLMPPPIEPPVMAAPLPYTLPYRQGPPTRGCLLSAIQLGYATGNRHVANAAVEACKRYAPVVYPSRNPPPISLGGLPLPDGDDR